MSNWTDKLYVAQDEPNKLDAYAKAVQLLKRKAQAQDRYDRAYRRMRRAVLAMERHRRQAARAQRSLDALLGPLGRQVAISSPEAKEVEDGDKQAR